MSDIQNKIIKLFVEGISDDIFDLMHSPYDSSDEEDYEEDYPCAKDDGSITTISENTKLFHGAHLDRSKEISVAKKLLARSGKKTSGGFITEGGLIWFTKDKDAAIEWASGGNDPIAGDAAQKKGENRKQGSVFVYTPNKKLNLIDRRHQLCQEEADFVNKFFKVPDYKEFQAGDKLSMIEYRFDSFGRDIDTYSTGDGTMYVIWPPLLEAMGFDGFLDPSGIALAYDKDLDVEDAKEYEL